jgi:magnesium-transporting ATPase (P-type)
LLRAYAWLGPLQAALSLGAFFYAYWLDGWRPGMALPASGFVYATATTMTFVGIVACQVGNAFACRSPNLSVRALGWRTNPALWIAVAFELALCCAFVYVPPLAKVFGFAPLRWEHWELVAVYPFMVLGIEELRKRLARLLAPRSHGLQAR